MQNTEAVAQSFEKAADSLNDMASPRVAEATTLRASLRMRAAQVRNGQRELDRVKEMLAELKKKTQDAG